MSTSASARVASLHRYPVKSLQGTSVDSLRVGPAGVEGDRARALLDAETGALLSAKRYSRLLEAEVEGEAIVLPAGERIGFDAPDAAQRLSEWIGRPVVLASSRPDVQVAYEMTFDPPNDEAEYYAIEAPAGSFLDLAAVHLVCTQTLDGCRAARPDLDWDVRRFRPNVVVDAPGLEPFGDDAWTGRRLRLGSVVLEGMQPTVRCAMPLRAQPGLASQPALYGALEDLHANHLGQYLSVVEPGEVRVGDPVEVL